MKTLSYSCIYGYPHRRYRLYKGVKEDSPQHTILFHMVHLAALTHKNGIIYYNKTRLLLYVYDRGTI